MRLTNNKKGFQLSEIPGIVIVLVVVAVVLGLGATVLDQVKTTQCSYSVGTDGKCYTCATGYAWNATVQNCNNVTNATALSTPIDMGTVAFNASAYGNSGLNTMASWQPTWAVIIAAAVVIGIIAAYLMFGKRD